MNKCQFSGRTTKEPELKYLPGNGTAVCSFTIAVRRDFKNKNNEYESDFLNCVAYGKTGELIAEYVKKGALFPIWGRVQIRKYEKDGVNHYMTEIIVEGFDFPPKNENSRFTPEDNASSIGREVDLDSDIPF
jgi:single-strand DNA-binding protein